MNKKNSCLYYRQLFFIQLKIIHNNCLFKISINTNEMELFIDLASLSFNYLIRRKFNQRNKNKIQDKISAL